MSLETSLKIRRYGDGTELPRVDEAWQRRDYDLQQEIWLDVTSTRQEVKTSISDIKFVYAAVIGDATVSMFRNRSPEPTKFTEMLLLFESDDIDTLSFSASADCTLHLYIAGS